MSAPVEVTVGVPGDVELTAATPADVEVTAGALVQVTTEGDGSARPQAAANAVLLTYSLAPEVGDAVYELKRATGTTTPDPVEIRGGGSPITMPVPDGWTVWRSFTWSGDYTPEVAQNVLLFLPGDSLWPSTYATVNADDGHFVPVSLPGLTVVAVGCDGTEAFDDNALFIGWNNDDSFIEGETTALAPATQFRPHVVASDDVTLRGGLSGLLSGKQRLSEAMAVLDSLGIFDGFVVTDIPADNSPSAADGTLSTLDESDGRNQLVTYHSETKRAALDAGLADNQRVGKLIGGLPTSARTLGGCLVQTRNVPAALYDVIAAASELTGFDFSGGNAVTAHLDLDGTDYESTVDSDVGDLQGFLGAFFGPFLGAGVTPAQNVTIPQTAEPAQTALISPTRGAGSSIAVTSISQDVNGLQAFVDALTFVDGDQLRVGISDQSNGGGHWLSVGTAGTHTNPDPGTNESENLHNAWLMVNCGAELGWRWVIRPFRSDEMSYTPEASEWETIRAALGDDALPDTIHLALEMLARAVATGSGGGASAFADLSDVVDGFDFTAGNIPVADGAKLISATPSEFLGGFGSAFGQDIVDTAEAYTDDAVAAHVAADDPHGDRAHADAQDAATLAAAETYADDAVAAHVAADDPHGDRAAAESYADTQDAATLTAAQSYAEGLVNALNAFTYKTGLDFSTNQNYEAADTGDAYSVSVAGHVGGPGGPRVDVGTLMVCIVDGSPSGNHATVGANWVILPGYNAVLAALATLTNAADKLAYFTGAGAAATTDFTATARQLLDDTSFTAMRLTLGLAIGTNVQAQSGTLDLLAALTTTSLGRGFLSLADHSAIVSYLALVAADIPALDASKITSGTMATARLGSGSASSSTFLRGDQTYAAPTVDVVSNVATNSVLGRVSSGSGDNEELTPAQVRSLIGTSTTDYVLDGTGAFRKRVQTYYVGAQGGVTTDNTDKLLGSITLPDLDSGDTVEFEFSGTWLNNTGSTRSITLTAKFANSMMLITPSIGNVTTSTTAAWRVAGRIRCTGSATQVGAMTGNVWVNASGTANGTASESQTAPVLGLYLKCAVATTTQTGTLLSGFATVTRA